MAGSLGDVGETAGEIRSISGHEQTLIPADSALTSTAHPPGGTLGCCDTMLVPLCSVMERPTRQRLRTATQSDSAPQRSGLQLPMHTASHEHHLGRRLPSETAGLPSSLRSSARYGQLGAARC